MIELRWDRIHPQSRIEASTGVLRAYLAPTIAWADIPCWQQEDIRRNIETRSRGRVTIG